MKNFYILLICFSAFQKCFGEAPPREIEKLLNLHEFQAAITASSHAQGGAPYLSSGCPIARFEDGRPVTDRDIIFLVKHLVETGRIKVSDFIQNLSSENIILRCAAGGVLEWKYPQLDTTYRYRDEPTTAENQAAIRYWNKTHSKRKALRKQGQ